jgi:hypothetical protein
LIIANCSLITDQDPDNFESGRGQPGGEGFEKSGHEHFTSDQKDPRVFSTDPVHPSRFRSLIRDGVKKNPILQEV